MTSGMRVLHLYWNPPTISLRAAIAQHLRAVSRAHAGGTLTLNAWHPVPQLIGRRCDAIVLHTTFLGMRWCPGYHEFRSRLDWIADLDVPKLALPQDEYDHAHVLDDWLADWGVTEVFTNFGEDARAKLYPRMHRKGRFHRVLTGYIDPSVRERLAGRVAPLADRPLDIVYRASQLPLWFGHHGQLKHEIAGVVRDAAGARGLRCDISTNPADTIHGERWFDFLASARTTVGVESGSSVLDARGEIRRTLLPLHSNAAGAPLPTLADAAQFLPPDWDAHRFFALSPRHFEAVMCKTAQILVEGDYEGILQAEKHYLPLCRDFSNLDQVLERMRDTSALSAMVGRAYADICATNRYSYERLTEVVRDVLAPVPRMTPSSGGAQSSAIWTQHPGVGFRATRAILPRLLEFCGLTRWLLSSGPGKIRRHAGIALMHRLSAVKQLAGRLRLRRRQPSVDETTAETSVRTVPVVESSPLRPSEPSHRQRAA